MYFSERVERRAQDMRTIVSARSTAEVGASIDRADDSRSPGTVAVGGDRRAFVPVAAHRLHRGRVMRPPRDTMRPWAPTKGRATT
jgi:hypothetical protein